MVGRAPTRSRGDTRPDSRPDAGAAGLGVRGLGAAGRREELLAQFAGQPVTVDAVEDRSLLGAISLFQNAGPALGDVVVLDLGYNDAADPTVFRGRIDGAMAALTGVKRVFWLNQHDWGPGRAGMNAELTAAAARYPNLEVIDWNAEVVAHPDEVYSDSIHLTPSGQIAMAALVRQHYDRYVTSLTPTTSTASTTSTTSTTPSSATRPSTGNAAAAAAVTDDDSGLDARDARDRRGRGPGGRARGGARGQASSRPSSWARSASGSVTGS